MVERQVITTGIEISHTGLFSLKEIKNYLTKIVIAKGYHGIEDTTDIVSEPHNKKHVMILKFAKRTSRYDESIFHTTFTFKNLRKAFAIRNGHKTSCNKGEVLVKFSGTTKSHKEGFVGYTPIRYFFTFMRSKFITKKYDKTPGEGLDADIKDVFDDLFLYIKHTDWKEIREAEKDVN